METTRLKSWTEFKSRVESLYEETNELRIKQRPSFVSEPVFRGQSDSSWGLQTTLERELKSELSVQSYILKILHPSVKLIDMGESSDQSQCDTLLKRSNRDLLDNLPLYESMARLRHKGFPSPLLDWTKSPYVAAFFALYPPTPANAKYAAIFVYREFLGEGKGYEEGKAQIRHLGHWASIHERHFRQQSVYTIAVREKNSILNYCRHEDAISERPYEWIKFDEIVKYEIPSSARPEAISDLHRMNITEYSLFGSQDSLVRTVGKMALGIQ